MKNTRNNSISVKTKGENGEQKSKYQSIRHSFIPFVELCACVRGDAIHRKCNARWISNGGDQALCQGHLDGSAALLKLCKWLFILDFAVLRDSN